MAQKKKTNTVVKDDLAEYAAKRAGITKIVAWVAIGVMVATTAVTMGVAPLISG